jgi:hypothetical protein
LTTETDKTASDGKVGIIGNYNVEATGEFADTKDRRGRRRERREKRVVEKR